ncbi:MAG: hypothetical protein EKK40_10205 [Bradyrhizobiaceae bacterium]|nr:MAG: hypothetical protein EKK40_10205 [Bradyrhizobiaceae bacterium]
MSDRLSAKEIVDLWKTAIEVEQHFNTVEMNVRNIFATIVVALIAGVGYTIKEKIGLICGISFAPVLCLAAIFMTALFYFVDRYWYHRLLIGAVKEATRLEEEISKMSDVHIRLSQQISEFSPVELPPLIKTLFGWVISEKRFKESGKLHSDGKIEFFYKSIMLMFAILAVVTFGVKVS